MAELVSRRPSINQGLVRDTALVVRHVGKWLASLEGARQRELALGVWRPWDGLCVVALAGVMNASNAGVLPRRLEPVIGSGPCRLVIELSRLTRMDQVGRETVLDMAHPITTGGGSVHLVAPADSIASGFENGDAGRGVLITPSLESALGHSGNSDRFSHPNAKTREEESWDSPPHKASTSGQPTRRV